MAGEWQIASLGDLIDVKHGYAFKGELIHDEPCGDVLLTPGNFAIGGGFKSGKFKYYDGPVPEEFVLREGDLIVTMTDLSKQADTLGYPAFVPARGDGRRYLHNQRLGKVLVTTPKEADASYLHYLMCSAEYRHEVLASATGTTVKHTSPERIRRFRFRRPPLPVQRAIAGFLGALDDKIELNRRMNETLEAIARAIFKSWFVNFDPVRAKAEGRQPYGMDAETAALFPDAFADSPLGRIPKGWKIGPLDELANFLNGLALQKYPPTGDDYLPVIKIRELRQGITESSGRAGPEIPEEYVVVDGDVLFSWSGSLELVVWCGGRGALNQHLFKVTSESAPPWFFYHSIMEHLPEFRAIAAGKATTMGHIQRHHLSEALTVTSDETAIRAANGIMEPMWNKIIANVVESRTLTELRDTLLPKLISGELRVGEAEKLVETA